jgi:sigma-B regulation protein RsbU (phosphoserine phosphatase)
MDGLTLLSKLQDSGANAMQRGVIIVSAYGDMANIRTAMNRGAMDFLTKPIDFSDLEATIAKVLAQISQRKQAARAREQLIALRQELNIAAGIQQAILPKKFPPFPERQDFELHATMIPAEEVGGDLFDFLLIDEDHLAFVIGDVSGKGVPAAIYMAVVRTLLRSGAMTQLSPGECLQYVNTALLSHSPTDMFVTLFYGILNTDTGEIQYAVGGHNPPFLFSADGQPRQLFASHLRRGEHAQASGLLRPLQFSFLRCRCEPSALMGGFSVCGLCSAEVSV